MMRKMILNSLVASLLLASAASAFAGKSKDLVEFDFAEKIASSGAFSEQFTFNTAASYNAVDGSVFASVLSSNFSSLSVKLFDAAGIALTETIGASELTAPGGISTLKATFADKAYTGFNLNPNTTYKLVVSGVSLQSGSTLNIHGTYVQSITAAVPEPETYSMLLAGLGMIGAIAMRRSRKS